MSKKYVYFFGAGKSDGNGDMKNTLGGKGAGLAEMTNLGIPVPAGFTIITDVCNEFLELGEKYPDGLWDQVSENLKKIENAMGAKFGDDSNPLLLSVRSGARLSMPGMMDTVLNIGLNDITTEALAKKSNNETFAYDAYRRFMTMFADVVMGIDRMKFEKALETEKENLGVEFDNELTVDALKNLVATYKELYRNETGSDFPSDPLDQMKKCVTAVFKSWNGDRAITYRKINGIPDHYGTASNVQAMVFGNMGDTSATGVAFTRHPGTGESAFFAECLINAQGEDVVAGIRTPLPIEEMQKILPEAYDELTEIYKKLEKHYKDMLDIEFTVQEEKLYMLQTRIGKRTAAAALKIAIDLVEEGMITKDEALMRIDPLALDQLLHPMIDPKAKVNVIASGLPASPGAAVGKAVFTAADAEECAEKGEKIILIRLETSPEDIGGMHAAQGILTAKGGMTSHAAVVARGMGKCCIAGCGALNINESAKTAKVGGHIIKRGDMISLNVTSNAGDLILGEAPLSQPALGADFKTIMSWVDEIRTLKVRTNADTPHDAEKALEFGAEGIGLCRTEHMFFEEDRIIAVREMILSDTTEERKKALKKLLPIQKSDFLGIFKVMDGLPVTVRLLDPPLHEFLPKTEEEMNVLADDMGVSREDIHHKNELLHEFNPMLGHRGCRLGVTYPEIYAMQARAIFEAACEQQKNGIRVIPEVMIPLVSLSKELELMKKVVDDVATEVMKEYGETVEYMIGTMIELPRAALLADKIAKHAEFFSFGTNDLTQTTFGLSRDDSEHFLPSYVEQGVLPEDPFVAIDEDGVGQLIKIGIERGRAARPGMKTGICGEHGGEPRSVNFCHNVGLDYVSCSPYRVPIAKLAAAQAALKAKK